MKKICVIMLFEQIHLSINNFNHIFLNILSLHFHYCGQHIVVWRPLIANQSNLNRNLLFADPGCGRGLDNKQIHSFVDFFIIADIGYGMRCESHLLCHPFGRNFLDKTILILVHPNYHS